MPAHARRSGRWARAGHSAASSCSRRASDARSCGSVRRRASGAGCPLTSGRLPRGRCTAARCEVVAVDGPAAPVDVTGRGLRLVVVGSGRIVSAIPSASGRAGRPPARCAARRCSSPAIRPGSTVWPASRPSRAPRRGARRSTWRRCTPGRFAPALRRMARVQQRLDATGSGFTAATPAVALEAALRRAVATPSRLRAVGATAAAVLLAFGLLAAGALRSGLLRRGRAARARRGDRGAACRAWRWPRRPSPSSLASSAGSGCQWSPRLFERAPAASRPGM